jgi:hypothetical protein
MSLLILIHPEEQCQLPLEAIEKCTLFKNNRNLAASPYAVQSSVSVGVFRDFISALGGKDIEITEANHIGLSQLAAEFGCSDLSGRLLQTFKEGELQCRIGGLEEWRKQHEREFEAQMRDFTEKLRSVDVTKFTRIEKSLQQLSTEVQTLRSDFSGKTDQLRSDFSKKTDELRSELSVKTEQLRSELSVKTEQLRS